MIGFASSLLLLTALQAPAPQEVEFQKRVDEAIDRGANFLTGFFRGGRVLETDLREFVCLALVHAGVPTDTPLLREHLPHLLREPLTSTYAAGIRALLWEKMDRRTYQPQLAAIARYLVTGQRENGQWDYSSGIIERSPAGPYPPPDARSRRGSTESGTQVADEIPPGPLVRIPPPRRTRKGSGDNSNTQFAMLGLLACERANLAAPRETWDRLHRWLVSAQNPDGGWGYHGRSKVAGNSYGSMTAAGVAGLIVSAFYLDQDWKREGAVLDGMDWLGRELRFDRNPGDGEWLFYWIWSVERTGTLSDTQMFGVHDWYRKGAEWLLRTQGSDGRWSESGDVRASGIATSSEALDTCYAILFLRRATPAPKRPRDVATGSKQP